MLTQGSCYNSFRVTTHLSFVRANMPRPAPPMTKRTSPCLDLRLASGKSVLIDSLDCATIRDARYKIGEQLGTPPDCVSLVTSAGLEPNDYDSVNLIGTGVTTIIIDYAKHAPVPRAGARLEALDRVLHVVAKRCKGECLTSKHVNKAVWNLRYTRHSGKSAAQVAEGVLRRLVEGGWLKTWRREGVRSARTGPCAGAAGRRGPPSTGTQPATPSE